MDYLVPFIEIKQVCKMAFKWAFDSGFDWLIDLEFNGPDNTVSFMSSRSVYLTSFFLDRLTPLSD